MVRKINQNGFSLIELLVIIGMLGVLASVTYVSLSGAREIAKDKSIASSMQSILIEANLYHTKTGSYANFCDDTTTTRMSQLLGTITVKAPSEPVCDDSDDTFAVNVALHAGNRYCVDSSKAFGETEHSNFTAGLCHF